MAQEGEAAGGGTEAATSAGEDVPILLRARLEQFASEKLLLANPEAQPSGDREGEQEQGEDHSAVRRSPDSEEVLRKCKPPMMRTFVVTPELLREDLEAAPALPTSTFREEAKRRVEQTSSSARGGRPAEALEYAFQPETPLCLWQTGGREERCVSHGLVRCCMEAWDRHLPLVLRPEHFWVMVLQGIAKHVEQHRELLREKFVAHQGKPTIRILRDSFLKGSLGNDWGGCVSEFALEMEKSMAPAAAKALLAGNRSEKSGGAARDFSTAGLAEQLAAKVTVMDIGKHYFEFRCMTRCGFPTVSLLGSLEDWRLLRQRAEEAIQSLCLIDFALDWLTALLPVLDRMVAAYEGKQEGTDPEFWNAMIKRGGRMGSGGFTGYTGWLQTFLPVLHDGRWNPWCKPYEASAEYVLKGLHPHVGPNVLPCDEVPSGESCAPMIWEYYGVELPMEFRSGFLGYTQDPISKAVCPVLGWYLVDKTPELKVDKAALELDPEFTLSRLREEVNAAARAA